MIPVTADTNAVYFHFFFIGALGSIACYVLARYIFQKEKAALFYTIYTFFILTYFIYGFSSLPTFSFLTFGYEPLNYLFTAGLINLVFIFYFFFASTFLEGGKRYPRLDRIIMTIIKIDLGIWCINTGLSFIVPGSGIVSILHHVIFLLIIGTAILGTVAVIRNWTYLEKIFTAGASALIIAGLYNLSLQLLRVYHGASFHPFISSDTMLIACVLIEQFTYAAALGYKSKVKSNKAIALERAWIKELEANKRLQDQLHASMLKYQEKLEKEVKERSDEIIRRNNELQQEKFQKGLEEYKRAAFESELKALRTQINPHFLFNCMNILSSFIYRDLKEEALDFVLKFSRLMRLVLENSTYHEVPVEKDLEALKLYVNLEAIRYDQAFRYEFHIDPELIKGDYKIPPLLLQPYVENAIKHGLGNKESGERLLKVNLVLQNEQIICEISDNGIGRKKATDIKIQSSGNPHRSLGMAVTESRINLLKELSYGSASVDVIDLDGDETGTLIRIMLPVN
ncbi:MAG: hypothetical protein EPN37_18650 [Chitinophagaceae bacterium]|nr:MAG: hypothetical protein EPN37_18650 [Chitinophagaceae bacterium]